MLTFWREPFVLLYVPTVLLGSKCVYGRHSRGVRDDGFR